MPNNNILKKNYKSGKGFSALAAIIIVAVLFAAGVSVYLLSPKPPVAQTPEIKTEIKTAGTLEDISITVPDLNISLSPLSKLELSSLNILAPNLPSTGIFSGISIDSDLSYNPSFDISAPAVQFSIPSVSATSAAAGPANQGDASPPQEQTKVDCSMFASAPACR